MGIRPRLLALLFVAVLTAAGCGEDQPPAGTRRAASPSPSPSAMPAPEPAAASPSVEPTATAPKPGSPFPRPEETQRARATPPAPPANRPGAVLQPTAPGRYRFDESGFSRTRGCVISERAVPSPTSLVVDPPDGNRQRSVRDRRGSDGQGSVSTAVLEYRADGVYLASLRQSQTTVLGSFEVAFEPSPPVLAIPARPVAGQTWSYSMTSTDGEVMVQADNVVEALDEVVTLGDGTPTPGLRLLVKTRTTGVTPQGSLDLTDTSRVWISIEHRMILREIGDSKGRAGLCQLESHVETLLASTTPR